jgi:peptide/nickel transport system permease protein
MKRYVWRRVGLGALTIVLTTFLVHLALYVAPGDPIGYLLNGQPATPERVAALREQYHLDDPFIVRYFAWVSDLFAGDLGRSSSFNADVSMLLATRIPTTIQLVLISMVFIFGFGLSIGIFAGLKSGGFDSFSMTIVTLLSSIPAFVGSYLLINFFAVQLGWFPAIGSGDGSVLSTLWHMTLPAIALALSAGAYVARTTRASVKVESSSEHVMTATVRGIPRRKILTRHIIRNALLPIMSLGGLLLVGLMVATAFVEQAFAINGLGSLLVVAARQQDFALVQAITLILVVCFVVVNLVVDVISWILDPRMRSDGA